MAVRVFPRRKGSLVLSHSTRADGGTVKCLSVDDEVGLNPNPTPLLVMSGWTLGTKGMGFTASMYGEDDEH